MSIFRSRPLRALGYLSMAVFPLFCLLVLDYMNYRNLDRLLQHCELQPGPVRFEIVVIYLVFLFFWALLRRSALTVGVMGGLSFLFAYINYTKVAVNGDNFFPQDMMMAGSAGELTSFISGGLPKWFWLGLAALVCWTIFLALTAADLPRGWFYRLSAASLVLVLVWSFCANRERTKTMLARFDMSTYDTALQRSNYSANGFVGGFALNVLTIRIEPPEGYTQETMQHLLELYQPVPASGQEEFDVIVILSESFFDARILPGVEFSQNPLERYDELLERPNCYSGTLYTTASGGGTVRPEFGMLTGLTTDYLPDVTTPYWFVNEEVPSYVSICKDAGYDTLAIHPYDRTFYARNQAYPYLGFDRFLDMEDLSQLVTAEYKRDYITDQSTLKLMEKCLDEAEAPTFMFVITMQNHQPYNAMDPADIQIKVTSPDLSEPALTALTTYTQGLYDADQMLGELADYIDQRERPTVVVFFGDHLPTLGSNYLAYRESGLFDPTDGLTPEELEQVYSTPYVIYSNRELEFDFFNQNRDNPISDYNMLNAVYRAVGLPRTPYMEMLADFYRDYPYYNVRLEIPVHSTRENFLKAMELVTYDRVLGHRWSK